MNELENVNESDFMTMTHDQREELTAHLSSHIIKTELDTFQNSLRKKISKVDEDILNDPDVKNLKDIIRKIKIPLEEETVKNFERINFIKDQIREAGEGEKMVSGGNMNHETRMKELKAKLNGLFKKMITIAQDLNFSVFKKLKSPNDLKPSFDR